MGAYEPICLGREFLTEQQISPLPPTQAHTRTQRPVVQHQFPQSVGLLGLHFLSSFQCLASRLSVNGA